MQRCRRWCYEHSFSIANGVGFVLSSVGFVLSPPSHMYDFCNMMQGIFGAGLVLAIFGRRFYEKGADPLEEPKP